MHPMNSTEKMFKMKYQLQKFTLVVLLLGVVLSIADAQRAKRDLERKRRQLMESMRKTKSELRETQHEKRNIERAYASTQQQLKQSKQKIETVNTVISSSSEIVERNYQVVDNLSNDLTRVKSDYSETIRKAFRQKLNYDFLYFLLSSDDCNHLVKKLHYVGQIDRFRKKQIKAILETRYELESRIVNLEQGMAKNAEQLATIEVQKKELDQKLGTQEDKLVDIKQQVDKLRKELNRQERQQEKISAAIDNIIKAEIEERTKAARAAALATTRFRNKENQNSSASREPRSENNNETDHREEKTITIRETPEVKALSDNFRNNKGKLPWPVKSGAIVKRFGRQPHETLRNVMISNNGIDIMTSEGNDVNAVFAGKVVAVQFIPGSNYLVILQHGSYYTVYSNLERVFVQKGNEIGLKQSIGRVAGNTVHFELWQNRSRENPASWIAK
jgi:murein hydrolase activator